VQHERQEQDHYDQHDEPENKVDRDVLERRQEPEVPARFQEVAEAHPVPRLARLGEGQVEGVRRRHDAEQQEHHYIYRYEGVAGTVATTSPPAPGASPSSLRDRQADGLRQHGRLARDLEAVGLRVVQDSAGHDGQLGRNGTARYQVWRDVLSPKAENVQGVCDQPGHTSGAAMAKVEDSGEAKRPLASCSAIQLLAAGT